MKIPSTDFEFSVCTENNIHEILELQDSVINSLPNPALLRKNTEQMFLDCTVSPNISIGVRYNGKLVGIGILYVPTSLEEDLSHLLINVDTSNKKSANYKLCMVDKDYRGNHLQYTLGELLEKKAKEQGIDIICATISPDNAYSRNNMIKLGYTFNTTLPKYGSIRDIFYKII